MDNKNKKEQLRLRKLSLRFHTPFIICFLSTLFLADNQVFAQFVNLLWYKNPARYFEESIFLK